MPQQWFEVPGGSWHILRDSVADGQLLRSLCGRYQKAEARPTLPQGKSCESCLRIAARTADVQETAAQ